MEFNLFGIYISGALLSAMVAGALQFPLRRLLGRLGVYRWVWHRSLFELSLFVILWGGVVWLMTLLDVSTSRS